MIPETTYDYEVKILRAYFEQTVRNIESSLIRLSTTDFTAAQQTATLAEIKEILALLDAGVKEWTTLYLEQAVKDGIVTSMISLGVVSTIAEANQALKFSQLNRNLIKTVIADTQSDLLQVTSNISRKTRVAVREATAHAMRSNLAKGSVGIRTIQRDILNTLDAATKNGIVDAVGRRWRPEVYAEMVARTKLFSAQREATMNDAVSRDVMYVRVSSHNAKDACRNYENKILKITPDAPGDYQYIGDISRRELFHPSCRHRLTSVRQPERSE